MNEKHIFKSHDDDFLDSIEYESFETCEYCLLIKDSMGLSYEKAQRIVKTLILWCMWNSKNSC